jgi:ribonuclease HI
VIKAYTDGACRKGNPGVCSCAYHIELPGGSVATGFFLGPELHTNNYAEYQGLVKLLEHLERNAYEPIAIHCDSKLVVEQVNQRWNVTSNELRPLMSKAYGLLTKGGHTLLHVKGHSGDPGNEAVDLLCNKVLDQEGY